MLIDEWVIFLANEPDTVIINCLQNIKRQLPPHVSDLGDAGKKVESGNDWSLRKSRYVLTPQALNAPVSPLELATETERIGIPYAKTYEQIAHERER